MAARRPESDEAVQALCSGDHEPRTWTTTPSPFPKQPFLTHPICFSSQRFDHVPLCGSIALTRCAHQYDNGPSDGGLMVLEGSFGLYNTFFESHESDAPPGGWSQRDSYHYKPEQLQWFYDRGCKWRKVEAGPGDVILWDSRCIHYGAAAEGHRPRVATCELVWV